MRTLSQTMIVKNEEKNISKALSWGKAICCEQIVVDTGSTDDTVKLAEKSGARVVHFAWCDDFSAAKNHALSLCSGDWIAFLDADEYLTEPMAKRLPDILMQAEEAGCGLIAARLSNLADDGHVMGAMTQIRFIRNHCGIHYKGRIHEQLVSDAGNRDCPEAAKTQIFDATEMLEIMHTGYTESAQAEKHTFERNRVLLERAIREEPDDRSLYEYLGDTYAGEKRYREAEAAYREAIKRLPKVCTIPDERIAQTFTNLIIIVSGYPDRTEELKKLYEEACRREPEDGDFDYFMGEWAIRNQRYSEAERYIRSGLEKLRRFGTYLRSAALSAHIDDAKRMLAEAEKQLWIREEAGKHARMAEMPQPGRKQLISFCPYIAYRNEQLLKDCGMVPYTFYRELGYAVTIVTAQREPFPYMEKLQGIRFDIVPDTEDQEDWIRFCISYIEQSPVRYDVLFCFGCYDIYDLLIPAYKKKMGGKAVLKLDANSWWMDFVHEGHRDFRGLLDSADIITCESRKVKALLSVKWQRPVEYFTNGMDESLFLEGLDYESKENVILTVGKIGQYVKAHDLLLRAFTAAADALPGWKLKLVGGVEEDFRKAIEALYETMPELRDRIILTGKITDKQALEEEYRKAKVFVISSRSEGGTPNVLVEAMRNGCYIVTSDIDGSLEATGEGSCGCVFPVMDEEALTACLLEVCRDEKRLRAGFTAGRNYCRRYFSLGKNVRRLERLLEMD